MWGVLAFGSVLPMFALAEPAFASIPCTADQIDITIAFTSGEARIGDRVVANQNCIYKDKGDGTKIADNPIFVFIVLTINYLITPAVGLLLVAAVVWAGILYATASGNAGQTKLAITILINCAWGLGLFAGLYSLVNFIVPGGLFK